MSRPFRFREQPWNILYVLGGGLYILAALPVWVILDAAPSWRPRPSWTLKRALVARVSRTIIGILVQTSLPKPALLSECDKNAQEVGFVWIDATPDLVVGEVREVAEKNGVQAERTAGFWYGPRGPIGEVGQRADAGERVVYHFHGGAHVCGTAHPNTPAGIVPICRGYLEHFGPNVRVFALEYRLAFAAPFERANPFPASLIDAIAGYRYLVHEVGFDPRHIILSGDSAGGGIALNLARYIGSVDLPSLPKPGGLVLLSPTMDWAQTHNGPESSMRTNAGCDAVGPLMECGYTRRALLGSLPEETAARSSWISPGSLRADWTPGMFSGLPPTVIVAGGAEYTLDPMHTVRDRIAQDIGENKVTMIVPTDALHDFLMAEWHEPERTEVLRELATWVQSL